MNVFLKTKNKKTQGRRRRREETSTTSKYLFALMNFGLSAAGDRSDFRGSLVLQRERERERKMERRRRHERERERERDIIRRKYPQVEEGKVPGENLTRPSAASLLVWFNNKDIRTIIAEQ